MSRLPPGRARSPAHWLLCAAIAATGCGSDSAKQAAEERIRAQVEKQTRKQVTELHCPSGGGGIEAGLTCQVTFEGGDQVSVEVVGTGLAGGVELRIEGESPEELLARRITASLAEHYGQEFKFTECPRVPVRKGLGFECTTTLRDGSKLPVTAQWTDNRGRYEFADKGVIVLDEVEEAVRAQLTADGQAGKVDCPGSILPSEPGASFECAIAYDNGKEGYAVVTVADWAGRISWELD